MDEHKAEPMSSGRPSAHGISFRRLIFAEPGQVVLASETLAQPGERQVLARTVLSGISHGTELAWYRGQAAALHKAWDPEGRLFNAGPGRCYPIAPGYETVASITALGKDVDEVTVGDLVYLDRPHAEAHIVSAVDAVAGRLPAGLAPERAIFFPLARVALGGVHDAAIRLGDTIVVTGLGTVGLLTIQLARLNGAQRVIGVDRYPARLQASRDLGVLTVDTSEVEDVAAEVRRLGPKEGADVAIEASGSYQLLNEAMRCCRVGGRVVTVASYSGSQTRLALDEEYHRNRITLLSSMTVNGCPQRAHPSWDLMRLNSTARGLITSGQLEVDGLITQRVPFEQASAAYEMISAHPESTIKVLLTYGDSRVATRYDVDHPMNDRYTPPARGELTELAATFAFGQLSGGAPIVTAYEAALAHYFGVRRALAVNSGSSALFAVLAVLGVRPGTHVVVPATAPLPTAMPILALGATPIIVDTQVDRLGLDPDDLARKVTRDTVAALSLPLWGYPADVMDVLPLLAECGIPLVEDAAQAHATRISRQYAGTLGIAGCFSTHDRKLLSTGEGGFVLTDDDDLFTCIDNFTRLGHLRGEQVGVNFKLAAPLAAIGLRRLAHLDEQLSRRRANANRILDTLVEGGPLEELGYAKHGAPNYYSLVLHATHAPEWVGRKLAGHGLIPDTLRWRYRPLHMQPLFSRWASPCPHAEELTRRTFQIPVHPGLMDDDVESIAACIRAITASIGGAS